MDYQTGLEKLTGRNRDRRKLANNTYLERRKGDVIAVRLHSTDVVTYHPNGDIVLDSGGWRTHTTKDRINGYIRGTGVCMWQENGQWIVSVRQTDSGKGAWASRCLFADGMVIHPDGTITGGTALAEYQENIKLRRKVRNYARAYVEALRAGQVPEPSNGDCWGCLMVSADGNGKGKRAPLGGRDHILSHMEEKYFVPSLLVRAFEEFGASMAMKDTAYRCMHQMEPGWPEFVFGDIRKVIARYCLREVGQAA